MTLPTKQISAEKVKKIKAMLWEGTLTQWEIANNIGVSQTSISNILRGYIHREVRWPDGSIGHMPVDRYEYLSWSQASGSAKRRVKYKRENEPSPEAKRAALLIEEVNKRVAVGENIDDIEFDDAGNLLPSKEKTLD